MSNYKSQEKTQYQVEDISPVKQKHGSLTCPWGVAVALALVKLHIFHIPLSYTIDSSHSTSFLICHCSIKGVDWPFAQKFVSYKVTPKLLLKIPFNKLQTENWGRTEEVLSFSCRMSGKVIKAQLSELVLHRSQWCGTSGLKYGLDM